MTAALALWWRLRALGGRESRLPGVLSVVAFAVSTAALLVCLAGLRAFEARNVAPVGPAAGDEMGEAYVALAWIATTCMVIPTLTLGAVAARLAIARRDQRLAALRLVGATSGQVTVMTLAEAATQAALGALGGIVGYAASLPLLATLTFQGRRLGVGELLLPAPLVLATVAAVVGLAVLAGVSSLAKVVISPLGVANRTTPRRLSLIRVAVALVACGVWFVVIESMKQPQTGVVVVLLAGVMLAVNAVGPFAVMVAGRLVARFARSATLLLAARRIVDDPRSTWRAVGALGLAIVIAGFTTLASAQSGGEHPEGDLLAIDVGTGAMVTLTIIAVLAATSTGVVQAARVVDQQPQYRSLALAGTSLRTLHRARALEVAVPLLVTVLLSAGFVLALMLPFVTMIGAAVVARFIGAVAASAALMMAAVLVSRPLVAQAARAL